MEGDIHESHARPIPTKRKGVHIRLFGMRQTGNAAAFGHSVRRRYHNLTADNALNTAHGGHLDGSPRARNGPQRLDGRSRHLARFNQFANVGHGLGSHVRVGDAVLGAQLAKVQRRR